MRFERSEMNPQQVRLWSRLLNSSNCPLRDLISDHLFQEDVVEIQEPFEEDEVRRALLYSTVSKIWTLPSELAAPQLLLIEQEEPGDVSASATASASASARAPNRTTVLSAAKTASSFESPTPATQNAKDDGGAAGRTAVMRFAHSQPRTLLSPTSAEACAEAHASEEEDAECAPAAGSSQVPNSPADLYSYRFTSESWGHFIYSALFILISVLTF